MLSPLQLAKINKLPDSFEIAYIGSDSCEHLMPSPSDVSFILSTRKKPVISLPILTDCFLSQAYPIYSGCGNIFSYFPSASMSCIDLDDMEGAIDQIQKVIDDKKYEAHLPDIMAAREKVLKEYNMFALMEKMMDANEGGKAPKHICIYPGGKYSLKGRYKRFLRWINNL